MKKLLALIIVLCLILGISSAAYAKTDQYKPVEWELSKKGVLTISCDGDMPDYTDDPAPWDSKRDKIKEVIIERGVTRIGAEAFEYCSHIEKVTLPDTLTSIGDYAFYHCSRMEEIMIPLSVEELGVYCFDHCEALESIAIPDGVEEIGECMFNCCASMEFIYIPSSVEDIGYSAFNSCRALEDVYYGGTADDWMDINIGGYNKWLKEASIHCGCYIYVD